MSIELIAEHAAIGTVFTGTGACLRGQCEHWYHRWSLGLIAVMLEAVVLTAVVG